MPPRRGRSSGRYRTGRKYHRGYYVGRNYRRKHGSMGILGAIFFLIMGLILFGNEDEKKLGWGIVTAILVLCLIASAGPAAPILIGLIVIFGIALLCGLNVSHGTHQPPVEPNNDEVLVKHPVERRSTTNENKTSSVAVSSAQKNPYRYEESKHTHLNKTSSVVKTKKIVEEPVNVSIEPIEMVNSGLVKGMAIGEMEWTHMEKGQIFEEEIPKKDFFDSIEEAKAEYDVPDDYIRIMIETNSDGTIKECPALVWKDNFFVNVLPLIKNSKISCWSIKSFKEAKYQLLKDVDPDSRYNSIGIVPLAAEFEDCFPEYQFDSKNGTYTSIFSFSDTISVTNTSAKEMFRLFGSEIIIEDEITCSDLYEPEIKEIYKKHLLWKNGIIDAGEYLETKEFYTAEYKKRESNQEKLDEQLIRARNLGLIE